MKDPYLVLGVKKELPSAKLEEVFKQLSDSLAPAKYEDGSRAAEQSVRALEACRSAYAAIMGGSREAIDYSIGAGLGARMRIGQLCLATHLISLEQLEEAVAAQAGSDKQLGEILQELHFISQQELDGLLIGQDLIVGDEEVKDPQALRLLAMGLITDELAVIGLLESRLTGESFINVLDRRKWLAKDLSDAIFSDTAGSA